MAGPRERPVRTVQFADRIYRISSPAAEGEDVLHIGDTLGWAGFFYATAVHLSTAVKYARLCTPPGKPNEPAYRVLAEGPLRALVEEDLPRWKIAGDEVALRAVYEMREGEETVRCHIWITPLRLARSYEVGAGVRNLPRCILGATSPDRRGWRSGSVDRARRSGARV